MFYFSIFFSPSSLIIISRYRSGILLPSPTGRGEPHSGAGEGLFLFRLHIPRRVFIRRLIALCHHRDE